MDRTEIINRLIFKHGLKNYLEIGTQNRANNFDKIVADQKICVDPDPMAQADCIMTSDEYFAMNPPTKFDLCFIDGLHHDDQVERDVINCLTLLNKNGFIIVHDCLPTNEAMQVIPRLVKVWTGNGWEAITRLRERGDLSIVTVDCDFGVGVIQRGNQEPLGRAEELKYDNFVKNRQQWMNVVSPDFFERMYL